MTTTNIGTCMKCGSDSPEYSDFSLDGDLIILEFTCGACGAAHEEVHKFVFVETRLKEDL